MSAYQVIECIHKCIRSAYTSFLSLSCCSPARIDGRDEEPPNTDVQDVEVGSVMQSVTGPSALMSLARELQVVPSHFPEKVHNHNIWRILRGILLEPLCHLSLSGSQARLPGLTGQEGGESVWAGEC